jgi:hypothetical protein
MAPRIALRHLDGFIQTGKMSWPSEYALPFIETLLHNEKQKAVLALPYECAPLFVFADENSDFSFAAYRLPQRFEDAQSVAPVFP